MKRVTQILTRGLGTAALSLSLSLTATACSDAVVTPDLGLSEDAVAFQGAQLAKGGKGGVTTTTSTESTATAESSSAATGDTESASVNGLRLVPRKWPIDRDITRSVEIGPGGGRVAILEAGFVLDIPAGALSEPTVITVTAKAGAYEDYEFGPHGIEFAVPVSMGFSTESRQVAKSLSTEAVGIYLSGEEAPTILELFPLTHQGFYVTFLTSHFSRYALAFGGYALAW
ncbi:MAG: hypothetical protein OEO23_14725 [Gemmatimonadota bacterium]|nr:hypothetical protein [Gemmatimonadota bacterium]